MPLATALKLLRTALVALQSQPPKVQEAVRLVERVINGLNARAHK